MCDALHRFFELIASLHFSGDFIGVVLLAFVVRWADKNLEKFRPLVLT